jgi:hypothetical protein
MWLDEDYLPIQHVSGKIFVSAGSKHHILSNAKYPALAE